MRASRKRFSVLVLVFICVVINYMDRSNISLASPLISKDLNLDSVKMGLVLSAFSWAYAILQIPGGWLVDVAGPRVMYALSLGLWSIVTVLLSCVNGFGSLFGLRLGLGAMEAPAFPINNRVVTSWFPSRERASAIGIYTSGQFVGLAFLTPVLVGIQTVVGWKGLFVTTGVVGVVWAFVWFLLYRDPQKSRANESELQYIRDNGGLVDWASAKDASGSRTTFRDLGVVLSKRKLWGVYIGQYALMTTLWFFLTWFPTYLVKYRHMAFIKMGFLGSLPFLAAFVGVIISGLISDFYVKRGRSLGAARKVPIIIGLLLSISIVGANYVNSSTLVIFFMALAFLGNGLASITWVLVSELAPSNLVGLTGGVFNFIGNISGIVTPIVIGYLARGGNFSPALVFVAVVAFIGAISYMFVVGEVKRIKLPKSSSVDTAAMS